MQHDFYQPTFPLHVADYIADAIFDHLRPHCTTIRVAGSVLRRKPQVKDIEIVAIPTPHHTDLFGAPEGRTPGFVEALQHYRIAKGNLHTGRYIKLFYQDDVYGPVPIDLFLPQPHDYYRILAIRTGPAEYSSHVLAHAWAKKGWCGTSDGLRLRSECTRHTSHWTCNTLNPLYPPIWGSEEEFFTWLGVPYTEPQHRHYEAV